MLPRQSHTSIARLLTLLIWTYQLDINTSQTPIPTVPPQHQSVDTQSKSTWAATASCKAASVEPLIKAYTVTHDALQPGSIHDIASIHTPSAQNGTQQQQGHASVALHPTSTGPAQHNLPQGRLRLRYPTSSVNLQLQDSRTHASILQPRSCCSLPSAMTRRAEKLIHRIIHPGSPVANLLPSGATNSRLVGADSGVGN